MHMHENPAMVLKRRGGVTDDGRVGVSRPAIPRPRGSVHYAVPVAAQRTGAGSDSVGSVWHRLLLTLTVGVALMVQLPTCTTTIAATTSPTTTATTTAARGRFECDLQSNHLTVPLPENCTAQAALVSAIVQECSGLDPRFRCVGDRFVSDAAVCDAAVGLLVNTLGRFSRGTASPAIVCDAGGIPSHAQTADCTDVTLPLINGMVTAYVDGTFDQCSLSTPTSTGTSTATSSPTTTPTSSGTTSATSSASTTETSSQTTTATSSPTTSVTSTPTSTTTTTPTSTPSTTATSSATTSGTSTGTSTPSTTPTTSASTTPTSTATSSPSTTATSTATSSPTSTRTSSATTTASTSPTTSVTSTATTTVSSTPTTSASTTQTSTPTTSSTTTPSTTPSSTPTSTITSSATTSGTSSATSTPTSTAHHSKFACFVDAVSSEEFLGSAATTNCSRHAGELNSVIAACRGAAAVATVSTVGCTAVAAPGASEFLFLEATGSGGCPNAELTAALAQFSPGTPQVQMRCVGNFLGTPRGECTAAAAALNTLTDALLIDGTFVGCERTTPTTTITSTPTSTPTSTMTSTATTSQSSTPTTTLTTTPSHGRLFCFPLSGDHYVAIEGGAEAIAAQLVLLNAVLEQCSATANVGLATASLSSTVDALAVQASADFPATVISLTSTIDAYSRGQSTASLSIAEVGFRFLKAATDAECREVVANLNGAIDARVDGSFVGCSLTTPTTSPTITTTTTQTSSPTSTVTSTVSTTQTATGSTSPTSTFTSSGTTSSTTSATTSATSTPTTTATATGTTSPTTTQTRSVTTSGTSTPTSTPSTTATTTLAICAAATCGGRGLCAEETSSRVDEGSGASDVTSDADIYYFFLPRVEHTCGCLPPYFGPACELVQSPAVSGNTSFALEMFIAITGGAVTQWSAAQTRSTQIFFSRLLEHFVGDIAVEVPVAAGRRLRRQFVVPTSAVVFINVSNISTAALASEMRARVSVVNESSFPGYILTDRINASTVRPLTFKLVNTTFLAAQDSGGNDSSNTDEALSTTNIVAAAVGGLLLVAIILVVVCICRTSREPRLQVNNLTYEPTGHGQLTHNAAFDRGSPIGLIRDLQSYEQGSPKHFYPPSDEVYVDPYPTLDRQRSLVTQLGNQAWKPSGSVSNRGTKVDRI